MMSQRRALSLAVAGLALLGGPAPACTRIHGIPGECRVRVVACDAPGAEGAAAPLEVSSVLVEGNWAHSACNPSSDGAVNVVSVSLELLEVHYRGRRRLIPRAPFSSGHAAEWDSSERRFAFWAPFERGEPARRRIGVCDVRAMSDSPAYQVVYEASAERSPFGFVWVPDQDALLVIERRIVNEVAFGAVVRVDVATREARDLVLEAGTLDFVMTTHHGSAGAAPRALIGSVGGLRVLDCVTGEEQRLPAPALVLHDVELSRDGRRAAVFYRRAVPGDDGTMFVGVYLLDLARLAAGEADGARQLYDGTDVHTLWLSPAGDEVLWATAWGAWRQRVEPDSKSRQLVVSEDTGLDYKGVAYDPTGTRVAITMGNRLLVHDTTTGTTTEAARFGDPATTFAAEPRWFDAKLVVSVFEDVTPRGARRTFNLGAPRDRAAEPPRDPRSPR